MLPTFSNPEWLWCLLLLPPLVALRVWSHVRSRKGAAGLISPRLTKELVIGARQWSRWIVFSLQLGGLCMLLLALARPQWGFEISEEESESRNIVIAIDTSRSMLATDLVPDRLTRAKLAAQDIVMALPEDRIALIAFAGKPFVQAPLTLDHDAVLESIQQFDSELIPRGGSNLTAATEMAIEVLGKVDSKESALIVFSDGEALEGRDRLDTLAEKAGQVGLTVITIGVGTENGSIIPEPDENGKPQPGVFVTDDEGKVVRSRLDPASLQELSRTLGGGAYLDLAATHSIARSVTDSLRQIEATRGVSQARRRPIDRFLWPLSASLVLFVTAWLLPGTSRFVERLWNALRQPASPEKPPLPAVAGKSRPPSRAGAALLLGLLILSPGVVVAGIGEVESAAYDAYRKQQFDEAIKAYRSELETAEPGRTRAWLNLGLGSAAFRAGDYALAKEAFGRSLAEGDEQLSQRAHYNLANTLFRNGEAILKDNANPKLPTIAKDDATKEAIAAQWEAAAEHYRSALALNPSDSDTKHNLDVVEQRMMLLNQPPPPEEEQDEEDKKDEEKKEDQEQQQQPQDQQKQPQQGDQPPQPDDPQNQPPQEPQPPENQPGDQQQQPPPPTDPSQDPNQPPPQGNQPQQPPQAPPPADDPPPDGELESKPDQKEPDSEMPQPPPSEAEVNPETGFSPEEARQRLRTLADEDLDARPPIRVPVQAEKYKNW